LAGITPNSKRNTAVTVISKDKRSFVFLLTCF
jgi:hypothetical protein